MIRLPGTATLASTLLLASLSLPAAAAADWTRWTTQSGPTAVSGQLIDAGTTVGVSYSGEVDFTQLNGTGVNYFQPLSTFTAANVPNAPAFDMIAISGTASLHTITFSQAVTDPVLAIVSLGQPGIGTQYSFSLAGGQSMSILSQGPSSAWGGCATCLSLSGTTLTGHEGDGLVQFRGTFTQLSWTGANPEYWNGITVGVAPVPEPAGWALLSLGLLAMLPLARRPLAHRPVQS